MNVNLANEISSMQSELESLRTDNHILKRSNEMLEFEKDQLLKALAKATTERDHHLEKKGQLKSLIDSAGQVLIMGIRKYHDELAQEQKVQEVPMEEMAPHLRLSDKAAE